MSFTFDQVAKFKVGEIYWENSQGGCYQFEVVSPIVINEDGYEGARTIKFQGMTLKTGETINFLLTDTFMHYAPKISNHQEYFSSQELRGIMGKMDD